MKGGLAGSKLVARLQRERAQCGAAAAGRRGQAVQHALVSSTKEQQVVAKEVKRAMQQSAALVAASLERLQVAEAAWDRDVRLNGVAVDGFPTVEQVLTFMSRMSRERQRMCLAQRGDRRKGRQKDLVRNYVAELANNRWASKFSVFARLESDVKKRYWADVFGGYKAMYAAASRPAQDVQDAERAMQLVAQTERVLQRQHVHRTEMFQMQDLLISETANINEALIAHAAIAVMQSTAARVGMFTKTRHDFKSARWDHDNPLRVRDVMHKVKKLVLKNASGACAGEATMQMQLTFPLGPPFSRSCEMFVLRIHVSR